jgi:hypothetical protein
MPPSRSSCAAAAARKSSASYRPGETAGGDELRQQSELIEQLGGESAAALIAGKRPVPPGRRVERVPADQHRARRLVEIEPQQGIGEADDRTAALAVAPPDRLRHAVIGAMRERVAVDDEQRPPPFIGHGSSSLAEPSADTSTSTARSCRRYYWPSLPTRSATVPE